LKNLLSVIKSIGWSSDPLRVTLDLLGPKSFGVANICQSACGVAGAGAGARKHGHARSGFMSLLWDPPPYLSLPSSGGTSGSLAHTPSHLTGTTAEGNTGATKSHQKKEKKVFCPSLGNGEEEGNGRITVLWVYLSPLYM